MPNNNAREDYISRINKVMDFIEANLDTDLKLIDLAKLASFSQFHFHRIFKAMVGETLRNYILRLRVEKSANMLALMPKKSITEIALDCGFGSSAHYARVFKQTYGMSASQWRDGGYHNYSKSDSKDSQTQSKLMKATGEISYYLDPTTNNLTWRIKMNEKSKLTANVEIKEIPDIHVAYIRHTGPYKGDESLFGRLFMQLMQWAQPRGLFNEKSKAFTIYHDDPKITDEDKLRMSVCLSVPENTEVDGEIGKTVLTAGKYGVAHFEIAPDQYEEAWNLIYSQWLPQSGYQPDDKPCFEHYLNNPKEHPEGKHIVDIYMPVKPL